MRWFLVEIFVLNLRYLGSSNMIDHVDTLDYWEAEDELSLSTEKPVSIFQSMQPNLAQIEVKQLSQSKAVEIDILKASNRSLTEAPPTENGEPIKVDMSILILQVRDIKELNEEVTLELNLRMYWKDPRLSYLVNEDGGGDRKFVAVSVKLLDRLWYPDIYLDHVKSISQPSIITRPASLRVYSDSTVRYSARFTIVMSCPMDFHMYPADTQKCGVDIKSYAYTSKILDVKWQQGRGAFLVDKLELPNFDVGLDRPENFTIETTSGSYAGVRFKVVLRRKLSYHMLQTYFPSMLFVKISWLSFLVQPESVPARMTLSMTTLLTLVSMFSSIRQGIPSVSYIKALDIWMVWCVLFVHFTLVEYAIVLKLNSLKRKPKPAQAVLVPVPAQSMLYKNAILGSQCENVGDIRAIYDPNKALAHNGNGNVADFSDPTRNEALGLSNQPYQILINDSDGGGKGKCGQFRHRFFRSNSTSPSPPNDDSNNHSTIGSGPSPSPTMGQGQAPPEQETGYKSLVVKIEQYTSIIIPSMFIIFNLIYWPWLLRALDASDDTTEYYHL